MAFAARVRASMQRASKFVLFAGWLFAALFIAAIFSAQLLTPLRLHATGFAEPAVITSCKLRVGLSGRGVGLMMYEAQTTAGAGRLSIQERGSATDAGPTVPSVRSQHAEKAVVVRGDPSLWKIVLAVHSDHSLFFMLMLSLVALLLTSRRVLKVTGYYFKEAGLLLGMSGTTTSTGQEVHLFRAKALTGLLALTLLYIALILVMASFLRALLYLSTPHDLLFGLVSFGLLTSIWSPLPAMLMKFMWNSYQSKGFAIVVQLVAAWAIAMGIWRVVIAFWTTAPEGFETPAQIAMAVLAALLGLTDLR